MSVLFIILVSVAYGFLGLVVARMIAGHIAWKASEKWNQERPDSTDWSTAWIFGVLTGIVWPIAPMVMLANRMSPTIGAEARHKQRLLEQRIKDLERNL